MLSLCVSFGVYAASPEEVAASAEALDTTCVNFTGGNEKVANAKKTRIDPTVFNGLEGKRIRTINFNRVSVFDKNDPDENNWLYLSLNKLHINTRSSVIRHQLLFREGDLVDVKHIQESERILRKRRYLTNAYIVPQVVCADQIDITVVTQDSWAIEPQVSLSKKAEDTQSGFAIADGNILGSGSGLTIGYAENDARNLVSYDINNPHVLNSKIATRIYYADTSDGHNSIFKLERPFYSLETPWSIGFYTEDITLAETIFQGGEEVNQYEHQSAESHIFLGVATDINDRFTQRWVVGLSGDEDKFIENENTVQIIPNARKEAYPWIEYQYLKNRFGVFKNINQIQRPEDIALGENLRFRLGYAGVDFDNPDDVLRYIGEYTYTEGFGEEHIVETGLSVNGRHHSRLEGVDSSIYGAHLAYNYFQDEKNRWYTSVRYDIGQDLAQYEELTVGAITGLRGYPTDYQRGNQRYVFSLERRYFSNVHIFNLMRMGVVAFYDMGKSWGIDSYGDNPLLSNVGIGLRFSSTKVRIGNVVRIDVAAPTSAKTGISEYQVTIGAFERF